MLRGLLAVFIIVPAIEIFLFIIVGRYIGLPLTFLLIIGTGLLGAWLMKREGGAVLAHIKAELAMGKLPGQTVVEGLCILIGGMLLLTPGFFTDLCGFLLLIPPVRRKAKDFILNWLRKQMAKGRFTFHYRR
ncbi:UPF0716 protein FxsA [Scopulibacillus darangshiensis]|uniref:UPF0716 protein FxsA n=1 Tax=Scopulibacillus darangshiensis TaxID=442528 RepID=A0A4R2PDC1_9BACL|nr:FxsA family protein [Scopulibacillus darangshiensis]TCP32091.1 UPF0716 protein FxsA [Scopulibacillus darangshiensis]